VKHLLKEAAWRPADVQLICVTTGPGSFTGLRIGVVTAKTLSYAIGAPLVGLNTLAVLAAGVPPSPARLWTILDAQRKELFAACFERHSINDVHPQTEVIGIDEFLQRLAPGDVVAGPPLSALHEHLPPGVNAAPSDQWNPLAGAAGRLGALLFSRGETINPLELVPHYYRKSAAEEKAARKMNG
jgi:tRNA threonylcarbamoyladenosine biosynthesis protein TsaB